VLELRIRPGSSVALPGNAPNCALRRKFPANCPEWGVIATARSCHATGAWFGCVRPIAGLQGNSMSRPYQPFSPHHSQTLKSHAARMRSALTPSEEALWSVLSGSQLGVAFRRQFVIGRFIADFAAPSIKLIVETDGGYHARRSIADAARDRKLQRLGWRVLRLPAALVLADLALAATVVRKHLGNRYGNHTVRQRDSSLLDAKPQPRNVRNKLDQFLRTHDTAKPRWREKLCSMAYLYQTTGPSTSNWHSLPPSRSPIGRLQ